MTQFGLQVAILQFGLYLVYELLVVLDLLLEPLRLLGLLDGPVEYAVLASRGFYHLVVLGLVDALVARVCFAVDPRAH